MAWIDWLILLIFVAAIVGGLKQGFLRAVCSLGGLFFGLVFASWNYASVAALLLPIVRFEPLASAFGFLLIVFLVTALANLLGWMLSRTAHTVGLGCLDSLFGALFGFFQGWLAVTLFILIVAAFFPQAHFLTAARLPHYFFASCHFGAHIGPADLTHRILDGLDIFQQQSPSWMHPDVSTL
ncbi:MAG: CvpA family protein [Terracidiphilus sp.]|nr:CvpA family protein [Terracidiphilus sp.]